MALSPLDMASFGWKALRGYPARTVLMLAAMAVGVSAVVVLTSLGEGARRYVTGEFAALGTNLLIVIPGRSETAGISPTTLMGETPRPLTLQDARALLRSHEVRRVAPLNIGSVEVSRRGRSRDVLLVGSSAQLLPLRHWKMAEGRFLPDVELERSIPVAVIGRKIRDELFGARPAVGEWLRIGERRFRVIGILATTGRSIDIKVEETVIVPVAAAQQLLNTSSLFRILVEAGNRGAVGPLRQFIVETLQKRHQGARDVTVVTQDAVLATFDRVFGALTLAVGGIAAISLAVAGILVMNVMLVAVSQRTTEIGLLKALGASSGQIVMLILVEAILLSALGAAAGLLLGELGSLLIRRLFPALPAIAPPWAVIAALGVAVGAGLLFSLLPARRAARLDPVAALARR